MKFCFICGKKTENLTEGYCEECYKNEFKILEVPKEFSFTVCPRCNFIKYRNNWKDIEIEELVKQKTKPLGKIVEIKVEKNDKIHISVKGFLKGNKPKKEVYDIPLKLKKVLCSQCIKKSTGYYEAVLQLRGNINDETIDIIDKQAIKQNEFYRLERVRNGFDLYMGSKSFANNAAELVKKRFGATIKKSFKLITRKEGKNIYRNIILVSIQW